MLKALFTLCISILLVQTLNAQRTFEIASQAGSFFPVENNGIISNEDWNAIPELNGYKYVMIQFSTLPNEHIVERLHQQSIELLSYLPTNSYYARVTAAFDLNRFTNINAISVFGLSSAQKIHTKIKTGEVPSYALEGNDYKLMITLYDGVYAEKILPLLKEKGAEILNVYNHQHITVKTNPIAIDGIAQLAGIQFINFTDAPFEKENILNKTDHRSNNLNSDYGAGRHYDGSGVHVVLTDDGTIGPHIDYQGRTIQTAVLGINNGDHGDHCAGIIMGAGNLDPKGRGMAPGCDLWVYEALNSNNYIMDDSIYTSPNMSIDVVSTSYSNGCNAGYNAGAESADRQIRTYKNIMRIFSAGNDGISNCGYGAGAGWGNITGGIKLAKNLITVANVTFTDGIASSSSRGPATDGRIKPDVSAVGTDVYSTVDTNNYALKTGTSMSCPGVAGVFAQLYQAYRELHSGQDPNTGLLKNVLMNTCDDLGNPGPDFKHGYGRINGLRAIKVLENAQHVNDSVNNGVTKTISLNVPPNTQQLKIMLNWLDPEAAVASVTALVNDLDLKVTNPASTVFLPWVLNHAPNATTLNANATRLADHLNNAEQVTIDNPIAGNYTIDVTGYNIAFGPQEYFITYEFIANDAIEMTYPIGGEGFNPTDVETIRWNAISNGGTFDLSYSIDNGSSWLSIVNGLPATQNYFNWAVPNLQSGNCKIKVSRGSFSSTSPSTFSIMNVPTNLSVTKVCPDTVTINWTPTTGATSYIIYQLGNKYMDSIGTTNGNSYDITGLNISDEHWFSIKSFNNINNALSSRTFAVQQVPGLLNCALATDAQMLSCLSPGKSSLLDCVNPNTVKVKVVIYNNGLTSLSNVPVSYQLNASSPVNEIYAGTIAPSSQIIYTFTTQLSAIPNGMNTLKTWTALTSDLFLSNDTLTTSFKLENSAIANLPWIENFEAATICPTVNTCDNTSCALPNNITNEQNLVIDQFDWKVFAGPTSTTSTGPDVDHTTNSASGKYIYLESSYCYEESAFLLSPCFAFSATAHPYVSYWYHMYGNGQGSLHVDAFADGQWDLDIINPVSGDQGNSWIQQNKDLSAYAGKTIYLRFRGITGINQRSDMALDDLQIVDSASASTILETNASNFSLFPNPSMQFIEINAQHNNHTFDEISIYNPQGAKVFGKTFNTKQSNVKVDISSYAKGIYWILLKNKNGIVFRNKIIKG